MTLYWGTTAYGSRSMVGTYLAIPLSGGSAMRYYGHHYRPYYAGYRYHRSNPYWWSRPYYYPWHSPYYHGVNIGLGFNFGYYNNSWLGLNYGYYGYRNYYNPWYYSPYVHAGYWYRPGLVRSHYVYTGLGSPYWGTSVVHHYYNYDAEPVYNEGETIIIERPAEGAVQDGGKTVLVRSDAGTAQGAQPARKPVDDEAFLESLDPAELSFVTGLVSFKGGDYEQAAQAWYQCALNAPDAEPPRVMLVPGLFALGEYKQAAGYLKEVSGKVEDFPRYRLDLLRLYGSEHRTNFDRHLQSLESYIELYPAQTDGYLLKGYVKYCAGDLAAAEIAFNNVLSLDNEITTARVFLGHIKNVKEGGEEKMPPVFDPFQSFLNTLQLRDVKKLEL